MESSVIKIFPTLAGAPELVGQSALIILPFQKQKPVKCGSFVPEPTKFTYIPTSLISLQNRFDGVEKSCAELFKEQSDSHVNSFPLENSMFSQPHSDLFMRISFGKQSVSDMNKTQRRAKNTSKGKQIKNCVPYNRGAVAELK